ncbi:hypothetical protein BVG16_13860 [Paenibacillus selenitireducens]|uniref:Uncharacterized protein n=1 Tax=Paenibacillus selenitireducens TaxID=1324314 RepID=A0A1T2XCN4_9BACL|nr:hypothetical protein [Paenibacillus selenitireducens]OPA77532.1 hypothetical protein BVG16_13860 [Paenibacillus selenitireducens]
MVSNILVKCDVCEAIINLKWQVGHIDEAPVSIVCPDCLTVLKFTLYTNNEEVTIDLKSKNATPVKRTTPKYYAETSSELLTFKISNQQNIIPGYTPFIRSTQMIGLDKYAAFHESFMRAVYIHKEHNHIFERINELYLNNNIKYLSLELAKQLDIEVTDSFSNEEIIRHLYSYNINYFNTFFHNSDFEEFNSQILEKMNLMKTNRYEEFNKFLIDQCSNEVLLGNDKKLYRTISSILSNYYYFIPATFLNYLPEGEIDQIYKDYTLTTTNFLDVKDIYITVYENLIEVYQLLLMLNNILERGNHSLMPDIKIDGKEINTLAKYQKLSKAHKLKFVELNEGFNIFMPKFERKIRNAIGHENWEYIPYEHMVKYGTDEVYILEYVYNCWSMFEKIISVYKIIQDVKIQREIAINTIR